MYQFQPRRFDGDDGWFSIGTVSFGTTGVFSLLAVLGMVIHAIEGNASPLTKYLFFDADGVTHGQIWRLVTWFIPNGISIWVLLSAAVMFLLGRELDRALGRERSLWFGLTLLLIPSVVAAVSWLILPDSAYFSSGLLGYPRAFTGIQSYLSTSIFLAFVLRIPKAMFFGAIPGWALAAIFIGLDYLGLMADRLWGAMLFLTFVLVLVWAACVAFGLTNVGPEFSVPGPRSHQGPIEPSALSKLKGRLRRSKPAEPTNLADYRSTSPREDNYEALGIDSILDQIAEKGIDSLSKEQRKILDLYRKR